jgi:hypothetical protein
MMVEDSVVPLLPDHTCHEECQAAGDVRHILLKQQNNGVSLLCISISTYITTPSLSEDHVWFEDRWMVASLCDE